MTADTPERERAAGGCVSVGEGTDGGREGGGGGIESLSDEEEASDSRETDLRGFFSLIFNDAQKEEKTKKKKEERKVGKTQKRRETGN